jgi:hypothetical protein
MSKQGCPETPTGVHVFGKEGNDLVCGLCGHRLVNCS